MVGWIMLVGMIGAAMVGFVIGTWVQSIYEDRLEQYNDEHFS